MTSTAPYTSDFHAEFSAETTRLLRRRFLLFACVLGGIGLLTVAFHFLAAAIKLGLPEESGRGIPARVVIGLRDSGPPLILALLSSLACTACAIAVHFGRVRDRSLLALTFTLVVFQGGLALLLLMFSGKPFLAVTSVLAAHVMASMFLPWTVRQALMPMAVILGGLVLWLVTLSGLSWVERAFYVSGSASLAIPGSLICALRHSSRLRRSQYSFLHRRYTEIRRELTDARRIHESLFPRPCREGPIQFSYVYQPMRQIGGDYLYARFARPAIEGAPAPLNLVVMDVTGHGVPAALTVNRLHGELERINAEHPDIAPGDVLRLLNRYVHLILADHSIFVTGICVRVDPLHAMVELASGGHPPAFIRAIDGTLHELPSTAPMLGAFADAEFDPAPLRVTFGPGDSLIMYTDGATEARAKDGRHLGVDGVRRILASAERPAAGWPEALLQSVDQHRAGPPEDDMLVIEVRRAFDRRTAPAAVVPEAQFRSRPKTTIFSFLGNSDGSR